MKNLEITFVSDEMVSVFENIKWFILESEKITFSDDGGFHQFSMADIDRIETT